MFHVEQSRKTKPDCSTWNIVERKTTTTYATIGGGQRKEKKLKTKVGALV